MCFTRNFHRLPDDVDSSPEYCFLEVFYHSSPQDQIHIRPSQDIGQEVLKFTDGEEAYGPVEIHQEIDVAPLPCMAPGA